MSSVSIIVFCIFPLMVSCACRFMCSLLSFDRKLVLSVLSWVWRMVSVIWIVKNRLLMVSCVYFHLFCVLFLCSCATYVWLLVTDVWCTENDYLLPCTPWMHPRHLTTSARAWGWQSNILLIISVSWYTNGQTQIPTLIHFVRPPNEIPVFPRKMTKLHA